MDDEEDVLALIILMIGLYVLQQKSFQYINRKCWIRAINMRRPYQGANNFHHLLQEMKHDPEMFFCYTRMSPCIFTQLLEIIKPFLTKKNYRALIPEQRLAVTLKYIF